MKPFEKILTAHIQKYPKLQPRDIVKLALQSEYGNSHMISDENDMLERLKDEINSVPVREDEELFENIGEKYVRLNLASPEARELSPEIINKMFIISSKEKSENSYAFESKLICAANMANRGLLPCSAKEFGEYLEYYTKRHMGEAMSHSTLYREAYSPSYRVVLSVWEKLIPLIKIVQNAAKAEERVILAIDGMAASGKSTAAKYLSQIFDAPIIHTDHFFLPPELRTKSRMDEPGGNLHRERFFTDVVQKLAIGEDFEYQLFDCSKNVLGQSIKIPASKVTIIEGAYSLHPDFGNYANVKVCMTIGAQTQSHRIMKRNGAIMHKRFLTEWIPLENRYLKHFDIGALCDLTVDTL